MNRNKFFKILTGEIKGLPIEEQHNALEFYKEFFNESISEEDAISKLPHPAQIASDLYDELGIEKNYGKKYSVSSIVCISIVLLLLSPFLFSAVVLYGSLFFLVPVSLIVAFGLLFFVCMVILLPAFLLNMATGITMFGLGLLSLGICMLCIKFQILVVRLTIGACKTLVRKVRGY